MITCIVATFLVLFVDYKYTKKYSDFVNVDAVITDVRREAIYHGKSQKHHTIFSSDTNTLMMVNYSAI